MNKATESQHTLHIDRGIVVSGATNQVPESTPHPFPQFEDYSMDESTMDTFIDQFAKQVDKTPDSIGLVFEGAQMNYRELDIRSNQLANFLNGIGISGGDAVILCVNPSMEMVIAFIGIWKSGATYVPLDPDLPAERITHIIKKTNAKAVVVDHETANIPALHETGNLTNLSDPKCTVWESSDIVPQKRPSPSDVAYVIYTSGSTGMPKGVAVRHKSIADYLTGLVRHVPQFAECRQFALGSPIYTDLGNTILYGSLINGGTLHLFTKEHFNNFAYTGAYFKDHGIDCLKIVPSHWKFLSNEEGGLIPRKLLIFGGEKLPSAFIQAIHLANPTCTVVNHYGPTETTIGKLLHIVEREREYDHTIPIGKPFSNTAIYVLDEHLRHCPIGTPGELHIGGSGVAVGYIGEPELTQNAFITIPGENNNAQRVYKTGDVVRWLSDGNIEYIGRKDDQVKIRGNRIELAEIEHHLRILHSVRDAVVAVWEDTPDNPRLVAYIVKQATAEPATELPQELITEWKKQLHASLPHYMIPNAWIAIARIPLTANNKVDRKALPVPERRQQPEAKNDPSTYSKSQRLAAEVWSRVLQRESVGLDDDFFDLGGHSLLAMQVLREIGRETASRLPVSTLFKNPVLRDFATLIDETYDTKVNLFRNKDASELPVIGPTETYVVPMIAPQQEIWLSCQLGGDEANLAYNQSVTIHLNGTLDVDALRKALNSTVLRHEALRARIDDTNETLLITPDCRATFIVANLEDISDEYGKHHAFDEFVRNEMRTPFDLQKGPLFRTFLHRFDSYTHRLTLVAHHIICDAIAMRVLVRDIASCYNAYRKGQALTLDPAPQISAYAAEELAFAESAEHRKMLDFWLAQHRDNNTTLDLPLDFSRPAVRTYNGDAMKHQLAEGTYEGLKSLAGKAGMSPAATLAAIVEVFLHHRTGQREVTLGLTTAGQFLTGHHEMVGHCVNLLPLKTTVDPSQPFMQYLSGRREGIYAAYENQRLTFGELLRELDLKRDRAHVPLVPFVVTIHVDGEAIPLFEGLDAETTPNPHASYTFEIFLNIHINSRDGSIAILWAYNTQLFSRETIGRMMEEFELLVTTVTATPSVRVGKSLPLPHPFPAFEHYSSEYPRETTLLDHVVNRVQKQPNAAAVLFEGNEITFGELDRKSNQLAHYLKEIGVTSNQFVILCVTPSIEMVIAFLGIWKAGATYVPIDPELPEERIKHIVKNTGATVAILNGETKHIGPLATIGNAVAIDQPDCPAWQYPDTQPHTKPSPGDGAYVIYTSGSTGNPKGVLISHESLVDYYFGLIKHLPQLLDCKEYILGSPLYTDLGNTVLYGSLINGGRLHLFNKERFNDPEHIGTYFATHDIDFLKIVPSHWNYFSKLGIDIAPKKILMLGGEGLQSTIVKELHDKGKRCAIVNEYGPTETTIGKLLHIVDPEREYGSEIPIGTPYSNAATYVLNENLAHCPIGVPGELYIGGVGLANGYLAEPELTKNAFADITVPGGETHRLYKTGDVVRWLPNGEIEYLGRKDEQVKIRGNRIELAEIENRVSQLDEIAQCAILAVNDPHHEKQLVAYAVQQPNITFDKESAIKRLRESLPEYMIPKHWAIIPEIPLNANGKADKKALLKMGYQIEKNENKFVTATTPTQLKLVEFWSTCLEIDKEIGIMDDFFELGGHSLIAVRIMAKIREHFGMKLPLASLFENATIEKLAQVIDEGQDPLKWDCVIPIRASGSKPPLFIVHGALLDVLYARLVLPYLDPEQPLYGIQGMGLSGKSKPAHSTEKIAAHYVDQVLALEPQGPYAIAGYSSGGVIAYEMARQLQQRGKHVPFLGLFDSRVSNGFGGFKGVLAFAKLVIFGLADFYGRKTAFLYFSLIGIDKIAQLTIAKISKSTYKKLFPVNYWTFKAILLYAYVVTKYKIVPGDVNTVLFKSPRKSNSPDDPLSATNGWSAIIKGPLKVTPIAINHAEIFNPEHVQDSGSKLQQELNEALKKLTEK